MCIYTIKMQILNIKKIPQGGGGSCGFTERPKLTLPVFRTYSIIFHFYI